VAKNKPKTKSETAKPRRLKQPSYKTFKHSKKIKHPDGPLPSAFTILKSSLAILKQDWKLFLTITLIYGALTVVFVRGFGGSLNLTELKDALKSGLEGSEGNLLTSITLFGYLLGSAGAANSPTGGVYQTLLVIVVSLVTIWALRQVYASHKIRARDAFYKGTYPLVQFTLILLVISLQLLPLIFGSWLYSAAVSNGIAVTGLERFVWAILAFLLALLSLYLICSSLFALYVVTLPDMTPMKALRSARQLVLYRRWTVLRKILFLPLMLLIVGALIMIPLILVFTPAAEWIFFLLSMAVLIIVHTYMYTLYRELL
jgi:hypothetical protein